MASDDHLLRQRFSTSRFEAASRQRLQAAARPDSNEFNSLVYEKPKTSFIVYRPAPWDTTNFAAAIAP